MKAWTWLTICLLDGSDGGKANSICGEGTRKKGCSTSGVFNSPVKVHYFIPSD